MRVIADLHIHSKYSRATSKQMDVEHLDLWARKKGIQILATGDFTHPQYLKELKEKLIEDSSGLLKLSTNLPATSHPPTSFILSGEISCIYKDKGKTRRLHLVLFAPSFAVVDKFNAELLKRGCNLKSDGRPIIGLSAKEVLKICLEIDERLMLVPAHAWTPWFAVFGSKSGYDSLEQCFEELTPSIYAIETGLSSDPAMNWRLSKLDNVMLISNSDAHSPENLGREANVFDIEKITYDEIFAILKNRDAKKFLYTIEFFPEEGKYHWDGHMKCKFSCAPKDSVKFKNICPICKKELTLGVDHRVQDLADREVGFKPARVVPFRSVVPLKEIIAECLQQGKASKRAQDLYEKMLAQKTEFEILLDLDEQAIIKISNDVIADAITRVRNGKVVIKPGYDGDYGIVKVFSEDEAKKLKPRQNVLF
ncbi:DNA helicase UvrD [Candidatus Falkowbacteria bacterium]|nr:DNA helicase UvrD [Candidatus Falkowbacteria bacterium]